jgi:2-hydroxychromene-2-carboxylate isomerase
MATLEFFYDFTSPYSYLASTRVEELCRRAGASLRWRPFLLGGVLKASGNRAPIEIPAKGRYMLLDLTRWARRLGVPFRFPSIFPVPSILALRAALAADKEGLLVPLTHAVFRAVWVEGKEIGTPEQLASVLDAAGLPGARLAAAAPAEKEALVKSTQEAVDRGAFGAPTFFVGDELFVGNDRMDLVEEELSRRGGGDAR